MDYDSSFPQSLALLWSVRQWTEVEAEYHHFARMGKCENSLDSLRMTRDAEISATVILRVVQYTQMESGPLFGVDNLSSGSRVVVFAEVK